MSYADTIAEVRALAEGRKHLPTVQTVPVFEYVCPRAKSTEPMTPFQRAIREAGVVPIITPTAPAKKKTAFATHLALFHVVTPGEFTTNDFAKFLTDETDWVGTDANSAAIQYLRRTDQVEVVAHTSPRVWKFKNLSTPCSENLRTADRPVSLSQFQPSALSL